MAVTPTGDESLVNDLTIGLQTTAHAAPVIAVSPVNSVVAFAGRGADDRSGIWAKLFNASGAQVGSDFRVNTTVQEAQVEPAVAVAADGSFVIVWSGRGVGDQHGIFLQRFDASGNRLGGETLVNSTVEGEQRDPSIVRTANGQFIVVWSGVGSGDFSGVFLQRIAADGSRIGEEVRVNTTTIDDQSTPAIAADASGNVLVVWSSRHQDGSDWGIFAQRFLPNGDRAGTEFRVNVTTAASQYAPSVAAQPDGFVVAWSSINQDGDGWGVFARRFSSTGVALSDAETRLNSATAGQQRDVTLSTSTTGRILATFSSAVPNGSGWEVLARTFFTSLQADGDATAANRGAVGANSGDQRWATGAWTATNAARIVFSGRGEDDSRGVFITAASVTQGPELRFNPIEDRTVNEGDAISFTISARASNGASVTYAIQQPTGAGATFDAATGLFRWTPGETHGGNDFTFTVTATAGTLTATETFTITVNEINQAPVLAAIGNRFVDEDEELTFAATATDADMPVQTLTYSLGAGAPAGATINAATGVFRWTPGADVAGQSVPVTIIVMDNGTPAMQDSETINVTVNEQAGT